MRWSTVLSTLLMVIYPTCVGFMHADPGTQLNILTPPHHGTTLDSINEYIGITEIMLAHSDISHDICASDILFYWVECRSLHVGVPEYRLRKVISTHFVGS